MEPVVHCRDVRPLCALVPTERVCAHLTHEVIPGFPLGTEVDTVPSLQGAASNAELKILCATILRRETQHGESGA